MKKDIALPYVLLHLVASRCVVAMRFAVLLRFALFSCVLLCFIVLRVVYCCDLLCFDLLCSVLCVLLRFVVLCLVSSVRLVVYC